MNIYVASSWRNPHQPLVVNAIRDMGHDVYDFRNPTGSFHWSQIHPQWESWDLEEYLRCLDHPLAEEGYQQDFEAMKAADLCVLVLPCGRSAHLEAGWFAGQGRPLIILVVGGVEPELMYKLASAVCGGDTLSVAIHQLSKMLAKVGTDSHA